MNTTEMIRISAKLDSELKKESQILAIKIGVDFQDYISESLIHYNKIVEKQLNDNKILNEDA